jgi:hypothetical protein
MYLPYLDCPAIFKVESAEKENNFSRRAATKEIGQNSGLSRIVSGNSTSFYKIIYELLAARAPRRTSWRAAGPWRGSCWHAVAWVVSHQACSCFLAQPSCLVVTGPRFRTIELIPDLLAQTGDRAAVVDQGTRVRRTFDRGSD